MNLKRSLGIICVTCIGTSTQLLAQLPEVESLSRVPAWVSEDNHPDGVASRVNTDNTEQRFESPYQSKSQAQDDRYSDEYSDTFTSPEAKLHLDNNLESTLEFEPSYNSGVNPGYPSPNINATSDFNYGAFTSAVPDGSSRVDTFDSYQPAETGLGRPSASAQAEYSAESAQLDPSNPMLSVFKKMDTLMQEVQELRGKLEEQNFAIQNLQQNIQQNQRSFSSDMAKPIEPEKVGEQLGTSFTQDQPRAVSAFDFSDSSASKVVVPQADQLKEQEMYQQAYQFIQSKDYNSALMGFKTLVKTYPRGQHAPNANYWMGEIYLVQGELDLAAHAFDEVYQEFPQHPKASDALLKLGYVEYAKGQWIRSRNLLTQVKSQFPNSTSARLADTRLQRMHQEGRI